MKIAVIGGTGFVGSRVVDEALARGHEVTAVVRHPDRVAPRERLAAVAADVNEPDALAAAVAGHDAVVSCFHPGGHNVGTNPLVYRDIVEGTRLMLEGLHRSGVSRLVYVGGCGSLYVRPGVMLIDDLEFIARHAKQGRPEGTYPPPEGPLAFDIPLGARMAYYLVERDTQLDWTFVSPSRFLGDFGGRSARIVYGTDDLIMIDGAPAKVDVMDLAFAVVEEVETPRHVRGHLTVASTD